MRVSFSIDHWELNAGFSTSQETLFNIETLNVYLEDGEITARGEALGVDYFGETARSMSHQVMDVARELEGGLDRRALQSLMPPGGARNAVDCALWDLECKRSGVRAWALAATTADPVTTLYTLSLDEADAMAREAHAQSGHAVFKLKLDQHAVAERVEAVRAARPDACLLIDANGAWDAALLGAVGDTLARCEIALLEQPLPRGDDDGLAGLDYPVPLCADESCQHRGELRALRGRYDAVNIKLDKSGGLTEALALVDEAGALGFELMVGNMLGSSLAMAPAFLVAQHCRWVDLDGPLWQRADRDPPIRYDGGVMSPPDAKLWG